LECLKHLQFQYFLSDWGKKQLVMKVAAMKSHGHFLKWVSHILWSNHVCMKPQNRELVRLSHYNRETAWHQDEKLALSDLSKDTAMCYHNGIWTRL